MTRKSRETPLNRASAVARMAALVALAAGLSGCVEGTPFPTGRSPFNPSSSLGGITPGKPGTTAQSSAIIADLSGRVAVLPASGSYAQVAQAVLSDAKGSAKADLRVARLTARAKSKNWLPQIGPTVSLSSLGDLATRLLIEQVLWDNGAKRAERDHAAADVEVAAVSLSVELNDTVAEGLKAYLSMLKARDQAAVADRSAAKIATYDNIMRQRVEGGLSDRSEARVLAQKLSEMQAMAQADRDAASAAQAQLQAMTARPVDQVSGLNALPLPEVLPEPLSVKLAQAEQGRAVAAAKMQRAGNLPSISAQASAGQGKPDLGLTMGVGQMLGFGTADTLAALDATEEAAGARVEKAGQDAARELVALRAKAQALRAKEARDAAVVEETGAGLSLFTEQYRMGRRSLMDLVNMYESYAQMAHAQAGLKYDIALIEVEIARQHGILVDGSNI